MTLEAAPHHAQFRKVRLAVISRVLAVEQLSPTTPGQKARLSGGLGLPKLAAFRN